MFQVFRGVIHLNFSVVQARYCAGKNTETVKITYIFVMNSSTKFYPNPLNVLRYETGIQKEK
jgi:hypothetical protein